MILSIIFSIILIVIMYNCLGRFDYKLNVFIYFIITFIANLFSEKASWIMSLAYSIVAALVMVYLYNKAYKKYNGAFGKFLLWCIIYEVIFFVVISVIIAIITIVAGNIAYNAIL